MEGKKVCSNYSITRVPGDGRCLFRSIAHGACLRSGMPALDDHNLQRELADELRDKVADEFIKRRQETKSFIEGDFDGYVSHMRNPRVWGGEPELLMASHFLEMPITVYVQDKDSSGLISIAKYGEEYGDENPVTVLYDGHGHYNALQIPGTVTGNHLEMPNIHDDKHSGGLISRVWRSIRGGKPSKSSLLGDYVNPSECYWQIKIM